MYGNYRLVEKCVSIIRTRFLVFARADEVVPVFVKPVVYE